MRKVSQFRIYRPTGAKSFVIFVLGEFGDDALGNSR